MSTIPLAPLTPDQPLDLPSRGRVGMLSLIIGESAIFTIFVVAYVFYIGKSLYGPTPAQVLEVPIFNSACSPAASLSGLLKAALRRTECGGFCYGGQPPSVLASSSLSARLVNG
jgi:cytochrome c oxidase subunit 3